jgi:hypothetical protein
VVADDPSCGAKNRNLACAIIRLRISLELVTEPATIGTPARASVVRLATTASSVPYSNRPPSDEAAMMAPSFGRGQSVTERSTSNFNGSSLDSSQRPAQLHPESVRPRGTRPLFDIWPFWKPGLKSTIDQTLALLKRAPVIHCRE